MVDLSKSSNVQDPNTGEIYNQQEGSPENNSQTGNNEPAQNFQTGSPEYTDQTNQGINEMASDQENQNNPYQENIPQNNQIDANNTSPPYNQYDANNTSPPPFVEDRRKKILVIGMILIVIILVLFGATVFIRRIFNQPAVNSENINLTYWGLWEDKNLLQPVFDDYKRNNPKVTIQYVVQDKIQYRERLQAAIGRNEGPDIFRYHNTWIPMLIKDLSPVPKSVYSDDDFKNIFYPVVTSDLKVQGNYYGIPLTIDGLLLFYNDDILKGANISPPQTWVDLQNAAAALTVKEKEKIITAGVAMGTAENIEHFSDILGLMMLQNGTQMTRSLFSCSDKTSTTCAVEALSFYRKMAERPNNFWDDTLDNSIIAFGSGKVAMIFAPSWQVFTIKTINPDLKFKTAKVPQLPCDKTSCPSVNFATYWVEGVSQKSKYQKQAWDFLKYLSSEDTMKKIYNIEVQSRKYFGEPYSRISLLSTLSDNEYISPLIDEAPTMQSFYLASRTYDGDTGLDTTLIKYIKDAVNSLSQGTSAETALKTADNGFKQVFSRFGIVSPAQ